VRNYFLVVALFSAVVSGCTCYTVEPGNRGVLVDWGEVKEPALGEGFGTTCAGCDVHEVSVRQQKQVVEAACFSSDLQQIKVRMAILYRIPEAKVITVFREFNGEPFDVLISPRAQEALKEATASRSAEQIVKQREVVKMEALEATRKKVGDTLVIEDLVIENIDLSKELEAAIEQKMVKEQEAAKAKFTKQQAEIEAEIAATRAQGEANATVARAKAEAEAIRIRGDALAKNPSVIQLELIQKWDGKTPHIVSGSGSGTSILLPATAP
jgi:prohibitin 2